MGHGWGGGTGGWVLLRNLGCVWGPKLLLYSNTTFIFTIYCRIGMEMVLEY